MPDPAVEAAYRAACYRIDLGGRWIERRIGLVDAVADAALSAAGCHARWSIVTPCNPGSRVLPATDNARRLREFVRELEAASWRSLSTISADAAGGWTEPGRCLLDVDTVALSALATRWGQCAWVDARLGAAPQLVWSAG